MNVNKSGSIKRKAPPPPVPKKPSVLGGKPFANEHTNEVSVRPTINNELSKKLGTPLSFKEKLSSVIAKDNTSNLSVTFPKKVVLESPEGRRKNEKLRTELEGILSNPRKFAETNAPSIEEPTSKSENPKSEKTFSLTEVSNITGTWKTEERVHDDTLDFTLSDTFDTSTYVDVEVDGSSTLSKQNSLDMGFDVEFPLVLPPPPMEDFSDDDDDDEFMQDDDHFIEGPVPPSPTESLNSAVKFIIPPPPPPDIGNDSGDESLMKPPSLFDSEFTDFSVNNVGNSIDTDDSDLELPGFDDDRNETNLNNLCNDNICVPSEKSISDKNIEDMDQRKHYFSMDNSSKSLYSIDFKRTNQTLQSGQMSSVCVDELKNKLKSTEGGNQSNKSQTKTDSNLRSCDNFENWSKNVTQEEKNNYRPDKFAVGVENQDDTTVLSGTEMDSGHSTGQSQDVSDAEKVVGKNISTAFSSETLNTVIDNQTDSRETSVTMKRKPLHKPTNCIKVNRTWSSCSSSSECDDTLLGQPQVNLRNMLMKHMKSFESETDNDEVDLDHVTGSRSAVVGVDDDSSSESEIETHLNDVEVAEWTKEDVGEWLELIGLPHLKSKFRSKNIDGKALSDIDMKLLEDMHISSTDDQELILSEIYALQNPCEGDLELSMLDALDKTSGEEREKLLTLIKAIQMPSNNAHPNNYIMSTTPKDHTNTQSLSSFKNPVIRVGQFEEESHANMNSEMQNDEIMSEKERAKREMLERLVADVYDPEEVSQKESIPVQEVKTKKKSKRKGFFASLRKKSNKKPKAMISDETLNMLSESNPQGMLKVFYTPQNGNEEIEIPLLVSVNTPSKSVCMMCLEYLSLHEDTKCFSIVISRKDRKVQNIGLTPSECPLMFQCKWTDMNTYQFELKHKFDGYLIINNEDVSQQEMISVKVGVSSQTTSKDIIPVLLKKFKEKGEQKNFCLKQSDKDECIGDATILLELPLHGYKFHVFKLVNALPEGSKQRKVSFTEVKKMETKISLLEKQVDRLTSQLENYKTSEYDLKLEKQDLESKIKQLEGDLNSKIQEIKNLQDESKNRSYTLKSPLLSRSNEEKMNGLKNENERLKLDIENKMYQLLHYENSSQSVKDLKNKLELEKQQLEEKCRKLEQLNQDMKETNESLRSCQKNKESGSSEQVKKLYAENKEYLKRLKMLEGKLCEAEDRLSEQLHHKESESVEMLDLRSQTESLEHHILDKDSKLLELEYKIQKKDRDIRGLEDQLEDEKRKLKNENEAKHDMERRYEDSIMKMDNLKQQWSEKEKLIQSLRNQLNKQEKKFNKQKTAIEAERNEKQDDIQNLQKLHQEEITLLQGKMDSLQKLLVQKDLNQKQKEFDYAKEKEELIVSRKDYERKLAAKDVVIERLEAKIAKVDLNTSSQLEQQQELLKSKEEAIQQIEMDVARLEIDHASKLREMSNLLRTKENLSTKLEARNKKLEAGNRESTKRFEKILSEKDRLLQQVNDERDKESQELKNKLRKCEEELSKKEKEMRDVNRKNTETKIFYDSRLKKREKDYRQQKYLLEKVLELVNTKAPSILLHIQESLDNDQPISPRQSSKKRLSKSTSEIQKPEDDWC